MNRKGQMDKFQIIAMVLFFDAFVITMMGFVGTAPATTEANAPIVLRLTSWQAINYITSFPYLWGFDIIFAIINIIFIFAIWSVAVGGS